MPKSKKARPTQVIMGSWIGIREEFLSKLSTITKKKWKERGYFRLISFAKRLSPTEIKLISKYEEKGQLTTIYKNGKKIEYMQGPVK